MRKRAGRAGPASLLNAKTMKRSLLLSVLIVSAVVRVAAQCALYPVNLTSRLGNASLVIDGEVVSSQSFYNGAGNYIFTSNLVRVNSTLKGHVAGSMIEVITEGGTIGLKRQTVEPSLQIPLETRGLFMLEPVLLPSQFGGQVYRAVADQQGFIRFDLKYNRAVEPFHVYNTIQDAFNEVGRILGIEPPSYEAPLQQGNRFSQATISSVTGFSPTNISAGTSSVLTISGSGFGSTQGTSYVEFENADDGGSTYIQPHSSQYVSWSNTQIQVMVPTRASGSGNGTAGTGQVRVTVGTSTLSTQTLTVDYGELNVFYSGACYSTRLQDFNGSGGMTWNMYTSFDANAAAKAAFKRSLETWRCNTYVNWQLGSTVSTNTIANDGINVVRFDISTELPSGVLGRCTSYFAGCISGTVVSWYVEELDICFDEPSTSAITWQMGPSLATGSQYDFESVSLHELGHGHQMSHVINSSDVMHYALSNAQNKRSLITNNINGGNDVMNRSIVSVCGNTVMSKLTATNCALSSVTASFSLASGTVCAGSTVILTDASLGSPTNFTWTTAGGSPSSSTLQNTSVVYSTGGTFSITLLVSDGTSTSSITQTIQVNAPTVSVASASICSGTSTVLTASGSTTYTWNPGSLTGATQTLSPGSTTIYTITGSIGTCTAGTTSTVNVTTTPTVSAPNATICAGGSTLITATGATGYTWNPGGMTGAAQTLNPASTTVYTITGENGSCTSARQVTVTVLSNPTVSVPNATICAGSSTLITATGATSYTWNPGSLTGASQNLNPSSTTVYTVSGANGSCLAAPAEFTIDVNAVPSLSASGATICSGTSATLTAAGATNYTWSPGALTGGTVVVNPSSTTVYTVTGETSGCSVAAIVTVVVQASPTVSVNDATLCTGSSTLMTASGATSYTWEPGTLTGNPQTLNPGATTVYTVTGETGGCVSTPAEFTITVTSTIGISVSNATICAGSSTVLTATGAAGFTWQPGNMTGATQSLNPSSTTVYTIEGASGSCTATAESTVEVAPLPTLSVSGETICAGSSTVLTASGATGYTWQPGNTVSTSISVSPTVTTNYTVTGSDGTCSQSETVQVVVNPLPSTAATASPSPLCRGLSTTLTPTGAQTYTVLNGPGLVFSPTITTTFTVVGTSSLGCVKSATLSVVVNATPNITFLPASPTVCTGGTVTVNAIGATSYTWNPGGLNGNSQALSPAVSTIYTVTATNAFGCAGTRTVNVSVVTVPTLAASASSSVFCAGGTTTLSATGASTFTWNPGNLTGASITVTPGVTTTYTVNGTSSGCNGNASIQITVDPIPVIGASATNGTLCAGSCATINPTGAQTYTILPGLTANVCPTVTTTFSVSGTSSAGCVSTTDATLSVTVNPNPTVSFSPVTPTLCSGNTVNVTATGATSFTWNPGALSGGSQNLSPAATTVYTVTGSVLGCSSTATIALGVTTTPTVSANSASICSSTSTLITATGATSYSWNPGGLTGATQSLNPASTTVYSITGFDGACPSAVKTITISVVATPTLSVTNASICSGNGTMVTVTGATSYTWNPGNLSGASQSLSPATTTNYTVTGANATCLDTKTLTVNVTITPTVSVNNGTICSSTSTIITTTGATTYSWNPGNLSGAAQSLNPASTTVYSITGFNGSCASALRTMTLTVVTTPTLSVTNASICSGNGTLVTVTGATNYTWNPGNLSGASQSLSPAATTNYTVIGANSACIDTKTLSVNVTITPTVSVNNGTICSSTSTVMTATGATTYSWNPGNLSGATQTLNPASTTIYSITGFNGICQSQIRTMTITVITTPTLGVTNASICSGNGTLMTVTGATNYTWNPGSLSGASQSLSPAATTNYTVTGANSTCTDTKTVTVNVTITPTVSANSATLCSGSSILITATGATTYTWNPGNLGGASQTFSPSATTVYTVVGSNGICAGAARNVTVTVIVMPTVSVNSGSICSGAAITVTATGATNYSWNPGNLSGATQTLNPGATTVYSITGYNGICSSGTAITVTVVPTPTLVVSNASICSGNSTLMTASGASVYVWNPGNLPGASQTLSPSITTVYTVTGNNSTCVNTKTVSINVTATPTLSASGATICSGTTAVITGTGAATFTWDPGNIAGPSATVTPLATTIFTLSGMNGTCPGVPVNATVVVNPTPTLSIPSSSLCSGTSVTVTATGASGYTWMPGALTGSTQTLSPSSTSVYTITGLTGSCSSVAETTLSVFATPTVIAQSDTICSGTSAVITATGATTYTWLPGNLSGATQTLSPVSTQVYTITGKTGACTSKDTTVIVGVITQPTISVSGATICIGDSVVVTATGASSFAWVPGPLSGASQTLQPASTTNYTITGSNSFCTHTAAIMVVVNPHPTLTLNSTHTLVCAGSPVIISANGATGYTFMPSSVSGNSATFTPQSTTSYTVTGEQDGCLSSAAITISVNACEGIIAADKAVARLYPNPAAQVFVIELDREINADVMVYDAASRLVAIQRINGTSAEVSLSHVASGVYFVRVKTSEGIIIEKKIIRE
jgi:hypothetical protein